MKRGTHYLELIINKSLIFRIKKSKHAQIWVETVLYTLIALVMIGLVLAFVRPKIIELQDQAIIEQSITIIEDISNIILSINQAGSGNQRVMKLVIKKGSLKVDGINNKILFEIESSYVYSEPETLITYGEGIEIITENKGEYNLVTISKDYSGENDITYSKKDILKTITESPTPYKLLISNEGGTQINFEII